MQVGSVGQQAGDGGFATPRRPPQNDRLQLACTHHPPKRPLRTDQMILPNHLGQRLRTEAVGKRAHSLGVKKGWSGQEKAILRLLLQRRCQQATVA